MTAVDSMTLKGMEPAWRLRWLTPARCRMILAAVLLLDVLGHVHYLNHDCPIDLAGDEAQYWDWSRNLDWSYYSKGPLVAYIIRASRAIFGDTIQGVRYPAIAFGVGSAIVTYLLTRRLFGSERLALGTVLLLHIIPLFIGGSVIMTIDPPMFFCWALGTYFAAGAIFERKQWNWPLVGLAIGVGFLAKYAAFLWFVGALVFLIFDRRTHWRGMLVAFIVALLCTIPVIVWNMQHGWVTFFHVARQTGVKGGSIAHGNLLELLGSQFLAVGPVIVALMIFGIHFAFSLEHRDNPHRQKLIFLTWIGVTFFALTVLTSLFTKVQVNWPAPAYFTLLILAAYYLATRLHDLDLWRPWRWWFYGTVIVGLITIPIAHDSAILFPVAKALKVDPAKVDVIMRLRGWRLLGEHVTAQLDQLGPDAFVMCDDYMQTAETAFYVKGQPRTYYAGSYFTDAKRFTQYDLWPDRQLSDPKLIGRNAIYVGKGGGLPKDIERAFERVEQLPELRVIVRGVTVRTFKTWRGFVFKGMNRSGGRGDY